VAFEDGGKAAGNRLACAVQPRRVCVDASVQSGSVIEPGFAPAVLSMSCGLKGVTSTNRLLIIPGMRVS